MYYLPQIYCITTNTPNPMMKYILFLAFISGSCLSYAQTHKLFFDRSGQPAAACFRLGDSVTKFRMDLSTEQEWKLEDADGIKYNLVYDQPYLAEINSLDSSMLSSFEPGILPEGDLISDAAFTLDGQKIVVICKHSNNVFFYDASDYRLIEITEVGEGPVDLTLNERAAFIACLYSKEVYVIDLMDYSVQNVITLLRNPSQVEVNPDETIVYVGFPSYMNGSVAAYDLSTHELIWESWEPFIHHYSWFGNAGRVFYSYYRFMLSPNGSQILASADDGYPLILDALTGEQAQKYFFGYSCGYNCSLTGDTIYYLATTNNDQLKMYRIDALSLLPIDSIIQDGIDYWEKTDLAVSPDGNKVMAGHAWENTNYLFDFGDMSFRTLPLSLLFTEHILQSSDRRYALCMDEFSITVFDFDLEEYLSSTGALWVPYGVASKAGNRLFVANGIITPYSNSVIKNEWFSFYNFSDPGNIIKDTSLVAGVMPEADVPYSATLSQDGEKILAANILSGNISILDKETHEPDTLIEIENILFCDAIPNTSCIWLSGLESSQAHLFDMTGYSIMKSLPINYSWCNMVSPSGEYIYALTGYDQLHKILVDGTNSQIINTTGVIFYKVQYFIIGTEICLFSTAGMSPDGNSILVTGNDQNLGPILQVIDTENLEVLVKLPISYESTFDIAFTTDSQRAILIYNKKIIQIVYLDGENSFIENTVTTANNCFSAAYNPFDDLFYVGGYNLLYTIDPASGELVATLPFNSEILLQVAVDKGGIPLIRTERKFYYDFVEYKLPGASQKFVYHEDLNRVIIPIPGPDRIMIFDPQMVEMHEIPLSGRNKPFNVYPNPVSGILTIEADVEIDQIKIFSMNHSLVFNRKYQDKKVSINTSGLYSGTYLVNIINSSGSFTEKIIIME
jgi:DNA-binding beta-propeller fold protein YncE